MSYNEEVLATKLLNPATLPAANPVLYLTMALAVTLPFNMVTRTPLCFEMSEWASKVLL
jgi:hypothetical protein